MFACSVFIVICLFCILYFISIFLLLLPTWRIKPDDDDADKDAGNQYGLFYATFYIDCASWCWCKTAS